MPEILADTLATAVHSASDTAARTYAADSAAAPVVRKAPVRYLGIGPELPSDADTAALPSSLPAVSDVSLADALAAPPVVLPAEPADTVCIVVAPSGAATGLEGTPRHIGIGDNSGVLAIISAVFLLVLISYWECRRLFATLRADLWEMRSRNNAFDEHTSNESSTMLLLGIQWCVYTALLLYSFINLTYGLPPADAFADVGKLIGIMAAYYVAQLVAYNMVGYTFTTPIGRRQFVRGFTASQSLLGFALIIPALVAIFYPEAARTMIFISAILYIIGRLIFIFKGFRIFYNNFSSLLYFILYLCTLEIIPVLILYKFSLIALGCNG